MTDDPNYKPPNYRFLYAVDSSQNGKICRFTVTEDLRKWVALASASRHPITAPEIRNTLAKAIRAERRGLAPWSPLKFRFQSKEHPCHELNLPDAPLPKTPLSTPSPRKLTSKSGRASKYWTPPPAPRFQFPPESPFSRMSPRELQICEILAMQGRDLTGASLKHDSGDVAVRLKISKGCAAGYVCRIHDKLGHPKPPGKRREVLLIGEAWRKAVKTATPIPSAEA